MMKTKSGGPSVTLKSFLIDIAGPYSPGNLRRPSMCIWKVQRNGIKPNTCIARQLQYCMRRFTFTGRALSLQKVHGISIRPSHQGVGM